MLVNHLWKQQKNKNNNSQFYLSFFEILGSVSTQGFGNHPRCRLPLGRLLCPYIQYLTKMFNV